MISSSVRIKLVQAVSSLTVSKVETFLVRDGLQSRGLENDVGSGLELERGLERVAAQEAWLNDQTSLPVENWLTSNGFTELDLNIAAIKEP